MAVKKSTPKKSGINRRKHARKPFLVLEIKGSHSNKIFLAYAENVSQGGLFLSGKPPLKIGDRFPIEFVLPDNKTMVRCTSEVVWKKKYDQPGFNAAEGIGIKFVDMDPDQKKLIGDWVDQEEAKNQNP
ncbi:MAG: PilZ domain-containing protein [Nitrospiria bacterium]